MSRQGLINLFLSIALIIYLLIAVSVSKKMAADAPCTGVEISVAPSETSTPFVTSDDINIELDDIRSQAAEMKASQFDLQGIEDFLTSLPNVERANVARLTNNRLTIDVVPMVPIARVFGPETSFYINKDGKRLTANSRYSVDAPVVNIPVDTMGGIEQIKPLLDAISSDPARAELVSAVKIAPSGDIYLVPNISGHLINFGDGTAIDDKFDRLFTFYRKVMPYKGWNYYDTISVKYAHQVVASIVPSKRRQAEVQVDDDTFDEVPFVDEQAAVAENIDITKPRFE